MVPPQPEPNGNSETRIGRSVSLDSAAALLGVSRRTIYNRIRDNRLQTIRTAGGSQRVLIDSLGPSEPVALNRLENARSLRHLASDEEQKSAQRDAPAR